MKGNGIFKRVLSLIMTFILVFSASVYAGTDKLTAKADSYSIYFLNDGGWDEVGAYSYNPELLGGWGTTIAESASELGGNWVKVNVSQLPPFNVIFYNRANDSERAELYLDGPEKIYVTKTGQAYSSKDAAEEAVSATPTTIYFLNTTDDKNALYDDVAGYAYAGSDSVASGWPGVAGENSSELSGFWTKIVIPVNATKNPFNLIINNNGAGSQLNDIYISDTENNFISVKNGEASLYSKQIEAEKAIGIEKSTEVYFLNNNDWENVNCYIYGNPGEALGGWPGVACQPAEELGGKWMKVNVPAEAPFNIICFNKDKDSERTELLVADSKHIYVTGSNAVYSSKMEAELAEGLADESLMTKLHFYNSLGWGDINGYFFEKEGSGESATSSTIGAGWPGKACVADASIGENWWTISVPKDADEAPFYAIFNDGVEQTEDVLIDNKTDVYMTVKGELFATAGEAEEAARSYVFEDGCEEGSNTDIDNFDVTYDKAGAKLAFITYEAESGNTNGTVLEDSRAYSTDIQTEASNRSAVKLTNSGDYVEITLQEKANALVIRYNMPDSQDGSGIDATLNLYVDGNKLESLNVTSKYQWVYGSYPYNNKPDNGRPHRYFDEVRVKLDKTYEAGSKIMLKKDAENTADYYVIDFIEAEEIENAKERPANSLSVTDFGAVANDGVDDRDAFENCIAAAKLEGKEVWIPEGTFDLVEKVSLVADSVTIRGAGIWYTNLQGAGVSFKYQGTSKFYDFSMTGVSKVRDDSGDLAAFEGNGKRATNITIKNIWIEHVKVGVWSANTDRMAIIGCRIRNTFADGINLCSGTNNSLVANNSMRNTGDDCIAIWPWLGDCTNNTIEHNTISVPTLANGIAIYGGSGNTAVGNLVMDTINNGAGIVVGSEFDTKKSFTGTTTVEDNELYRCGSMQTDENYPIGAIWLWSSWTDMDAEFNICNNKIFDCTKEGILIECNSILKTVNIVNNTVDGATDGIYVFEGSNNYGYGSGAGIVSNLQAKNITGELINNGNPNFVLTVNNNSNSGNGNSDNGSSNSSSNSNTNNSNVGNSSVGASEEKTADADDKKTDAEKVTEQIIVVKRGDSLYKIAKANKVTVKELLTWNPTINNSNLIYVGQKIIVRKNNQKNSDGRDEFYTVMRGDCLSKIAKKYKVKLVKLYELNPELIQKKYIYAGQRIRIK